MKICPSYLVLRHLGGGENKRWVSCRIPRVELDNSLQEKNRKLDIMTLEILKDTRLRNI
jgi:hypothetical protein